MGVEITYQNLTNIAFILAAGFFAVSIILFFALDIRGIIKDRGGALVKGQIEEIRAKNVAVAQHRGKVNVFEELERRSKPRQSNTGSLRIMSTGDSSRMVKKAGSASNQGTVLLHQAAKAINPSFVIEKSIVFVATSEVI